MTITQTIRVEEEMHLVNTTSEPNYATNILVINVWLYTKHIFFLDWDLDNTSLHSFRGFR